MTSKRRNLMKETIKNIIYLARRFKLVTCLNLAGLVIAFAAFYLLMTQIIYQSTYNRDLKDVERLYRMESDNVYNEWEFSNMVCRPFTDALGTLDEVESWSVAYNPGNDNYYRLKFLKGEKSLTDTLPYQIYGGNKSVISALTDKVLDGDIELPDYYTNEIIIPAHIAKEYFGTVKAAGKQMLAYYPDRNYPFTVRGVYEDFPANSELSNSIYYYYATLAIDSLALEAGYQCIVKFKTVPKDLKAFVSDRLKPAIIKHLKGGLTDPEMQEVLEEDIEQVETTNIKFTPLTESYFEHSSFTPGERGYRGLRDVLMLACLLVLVIAAINFLNFTLAESPMRIRGMNTRLVLGASRRSLRAGIIGEGIITSVIACIIALIVCRLLPLLSVTQKLTNGSLALSDHPVLIIAMLALAVIVGITASVYPGSFATSFPPAMALKGNFGLTPQGRKLRHLLIRFQLMISMLMIIYLGMLYRQSWFIFNSDYGYDHRQILMSELPLPDSWNYCADNDSLHDAIIKIPGVKDVAFAESQLGIIDGHSAIWTKQNGETFKFSVTHISHNYLSTMGIHLIDGRDFTPQDTLAAVINKATRNRWRWMNLGTKISTGSDTSGPDSTVIVGLTDNIRYNTVRASNDQPFIMVFKKDYELLGNMIVRLAPGADKKDLKKRIQGVLQAKYGSEAKPVKDYKEMLVGAYSNELRYLNQMVIICFICLVITLVGVFCLTLFETEYRRKEIGIRKISGATTREILWLLCQQYVKHILLAFAIAAPLSIAIGFFTLKYFKMYAPIDWWLFPLALVLVGGVVLGTVVLQSLRAARENPANSIKSE